MIVDVVVVVLVLLYALNGYRNGALVGALSLVGLVGGAVGGAQLAPHLAQRVTTPGARIAVALVCVLGLAVVGQLLLVAVGARLRSRVRNRGARRVDAVGGAVLGVVSVLVVTWMVAVPLASSSSAEVSTQVRASRIVRAVDAAMPAAGQQLYRSLRSTIDQSGFPSVFGDLGPSRIADVAAPDPALLASPVVGQVQGSVLKVVGSAMVCGRGMEGSAFVYAPQHVLTNAHVVAGTDRVQVVAPEQGTLDARVVGFDPHSDVAVLYVPGLQATPMSFASAPAAAGDDALVLGYPQDGPFDVRAARVRERLTATGRDIYDKGSVTRSVYSVRALVRSGNSGGPLVDRAGHVLGIVFATAVDAPDTGFVLTDAQVSGDAAAGATATMGVDTGACTA